MPADPRGSTPATPYPVDLVGAPRAGAGPIDPAGLRSLARLVLGWLRAGQGEVYTADSRSTPADQNSAAGRPPDRHSRPTT
jgi:hypothetical protein